jgi:spermidine synthase
LTTFDLARLLSVPAGTAPGHARRATNVAHADHSDWLNVPAAVLRESGVILLREPPDADTDELTVSLCAGNYHKPFVVDDGRERRLHFSLAYVQSAMDIHDPYALRIAYTRKMMAFLLFLPRPKHVLIVGLGGGSLTKFCYRRLPRARVTTVEVDEDVIAFGELFGVPAPDARMSIVHADATDYLATTAERADVILLDGFDKLGIVPTFCDAAFYRNLRARLRPQGMLVMNVAGAEDTRCAHLGLIADTFLDNLIVQEVGNDGNRVVFAFNDPDFVPDWDRIKREAKRLAQHHGLDFPAFAHKLRRSHHRQSHNRLR